MMARFAVLFMTMLSFAFHAEAKSNRALKLEGVPAGTVAQIKKRSPGLFEGNVTLAEIDELIRWMMATRKFSNIEVVERGPPEAREIVLMASLLRRIKDIQISGNRRFKYDEIVRVLEINPGQTFERKDLVAASDRLIDMYEGAAYFNTRIEIDFTLPTENDVSINVSVNEGSPCRISDVSFETTNKPLAERIEKMARYQVLHKECSEETRLDFQKDLSDYFAENRFLTARISTPAIVFNADKTQAKYTYLIESPYRYEFVFEGNTFFEEGTIIRRVELDKLFGLTTSPAADLADRIRKLYQANGFANVEVSYKERNFEESQKHQIEFLIKEGQRIRIRKIQVSGTISRPTKYYADFITRNSSELIARGFYNRKEFELGYENLKTELQNQGFLKAKIQQVRTEYDKSGANVTIFLTLDEGPLTQVREIRFDGITAFSNSQLADVMTVKSQAPLSLKELESSIARLKEFYHSRGFLEMQILNEGIFDGEDAIIIYNEAHTQASITIQIKEGPKVTVSSIAIEGNSFTKSYVILRELEFNIGDTLTPTKIDESRYRLQKLGLFSNVEIRTLEQGTNIAERTVIIGISERDPGLFTSGVGLTNERNFTYRGHLGVAYGNLGGTGRAVSGRLDLEYAGDPSISFLENAITFGYLEPYIFGGRNRGRIKLTREQKFSEKIQVNNTNSIIIEEQNNVEFLAERDLTRNLKLTYKLWGFSNQRFFDRSSHHTTKTQDIAKTGPLLEYDRRDNVFLPTKGSYTFLNAEYSDPKFGSSNDHGEIINFTKLNAGTNHYFRIFGRPRLVWYASVRGGYLANISKDSASGVPATEAFFLGGRQTIRGFDSSSEIERVPNKSQLGVTKLSDFHVRKDSHYYLLKTELRFPLAGEVGGVLFYDGGAVLINQPDVRIKDPYRDSYGFGFRLNTPVGAVSLELAFKLDRKDFGDAGKESEKAIHFYIATQ